MRCGFIPATSKGEFPQLIGLERKLLMAVFCDHVHVLPLELDVPRSYAGLRATIPISSLVWSSG